jgi:hypothetical protein
VSCDAPAILVLLLLSALEIKFIVRNWNKFLCYENKI